MLPTQNNVCCLSCVPEQFVQMQDLWNSRNLQRPESAEMYIKAYPDILALGVQEHLECCCQMMILQRGLIIVGQSNRVSGLDEKVIIDASMLEVMNDGRPVGAEV